MKIFLSQKYESTIIRKGISQEKSWNNHDDGEEYRCFSKVSVFECIKRVKNDHKDDIYWRV